MLHNALSHKGRSVASGGHKMYPEDFSTEAIKLRPAFKLYLVGGAERRKIRARPSTVPNDFALAGARCRPMNSFLPSPKVTSRPLALQTKLKRHVIGLVAADDDVGTDLGRVTVDAGPDRVLGVPAPPIHKPCLKSALKLARCTQAWGLIHSDPGRLAAQQPGRCRRTRSGERIDETWAWRTPADVAREARPLADGAPREQRATEVA